ncbi:glycosyl hydrolase [Diplocloster hominis]|uniref:glycosyl hydrolase n=1 Tax=Diplocloster hominis TaxID=3079010 RepID=UPI0031BB2216
MRTIEELKLELTNPSEAYRSAPFWAWNDRLKEGELVRQIDGMKEQGMGGFFIHSREGLETEYLSEEWMQAVGTAVDRAAKQHMEAWIYDEDKWPSGSAGGLVSKAERKKYTAKAISLEVFDAGRLPDRTIRMGEACADGTVVALVSARIEGRTIGEYTREEVLKAGLKIPDGMAWLVFRLEVSGESEWYNGFAPSDNLNPDAVRTFLDLTHERYKVRFQLEFGRTVKGFFTDEPNFCDFYSVFTKGRPWIPWGEGMEEYFREKRGYSFYKYLPYLYYDGEGCEKIRHDYWYTLTERFSECYAKQLYDWCEENQLQMTGHMLYENDLGYGTRVCGAAMPHYRYMHAPGIDILGEQTQEYLTVKQCTSVANQYNRDMVLTETYGCTGWDFTFEGQKWLGDWQFVLGVNRRCQHLALYSITGCRKRDYPPVFNYQTTWWENNRILEDYFGRVSACVRTGEVVRDILVIHPMSTIWTMCASAPDEDLNHVEMNMGWLDEHIFRLNRAGEEYNRLAKMLMGNHQDFDFGDEIILEEAGRAENGKLCVQERAYRIVIVPRVATLFSSTVKLLNDFMDQGGAVIWTGPMVSMIDGKYIPDESKPGKETDCWETLTGDVNGCEIPSCDTTQCGIRSLAQYPNRCRIKGLEQHPNLHRTEDYEQTLSRLNHINSRLLRVKNDRMQEDTDILSMIRKTQDGYLIFAVNNDREHQHRVMMEFAAAGAVESYDALTDVTRPVAVEAAGNGGIKFVETFTPAMSCVYFIRTGQKPLEGSAQFPYEHPHRADKVWACLGPEVLITRDMENVLTLDRCSYRLADTEQEISRLPWSPVLEVWQAQRQMRDTMGLQQIYYNGAPQRYSWIYGECGTDGRIFELKFQFEVKEVPDGALYVVVEKPLDFHLTCNQQACQETTDYFLDRKMIRFRVPGLKKGENELILRGIYRNTTELEDIYLLGDFMVDQDRCIVQDRGTLHFGDWTMQGLFHYPGSVVYHFQVEKSPERQKRYELKLGDYRGTLGKVTVNGKDAGILIGNTRRNVDITDYLTMDCNAIDIQVIGSPRNMFGPFHQKYTGCSRISWEDFRTTGESHTDAYVLKPYGLQGQIVIAELEGEITHDH